MRFGSLAAYRQTTARSGSAGIATPTFSKRAGWPRTKKLPANWSDSTNFLYDGAVAIDGMSAAVQAAFAEGRLFSDLGLDWAVPGEEIDLVDYRYFPTFRTL